MLPSYHSGSLPIPSPILLNSFAPSLLSSILHNQFTHHHSLASYVTKKAETFRKIFHVFYHLMCSPTSIRARYTLPACPPVTLGGILGLPAQTPLLYWIPSLSMPQGYFSGNSSPPSCTINFPPFPGRLP